jgi:hypothetical protein
MIKWKLELLVGYQLESGSYKNIYNGHFIDENGNEYDEQGVFIQHVQDDDGYRN